MYIRIGGAGAMKFAKIFKSGNSQALRLPKEFQFNCKEVEIIRHGNDLLIREKAESLKHAFELLANMPSDFFSSEREDLPPQKRESF
jgi:antitoxin VapB